MNNRQPENIEMSSPKGLLRGGSFGSEDHQATLLSAFRAKNLELFSKTLGESECKPDHLYDGADYMYMLDILAKEPDCEEFAEVLIKAGAKVDRLNEVRGKAPIHFAVDAGNLKMVKLLIEKGTDINILDNTGSTPLHYVVKQKWQHNDIENGYRQCLSYLLQLENLKLNVPNRKGQTAIHLAALQGAEEAIKMMLEMGSKLDLDSYRVGASKKTAREVIMDKFPHLEPDLPTVWGSEPIQIIKMDSHKLFHLLHNNEEERFCSAFKKEMEDKAQKILLTATDGAYTFLQFACQNGQIKAVKTLLEYEVDINYTPSDKRRPILFACDRGDLEMVSLLLDHNPDLSPDEHKETVLHAIVKKSLESPKYSECLDLLLIRISKTNLDINAQDVKGNTPLHYAVKYGDEKCVLALLKHGAYIGSINKFGEPPIAHMTCSVLGQHLDSCVDSNGHLPREEDYALMLNYKFLMPSKRTFGSLEEVNVSLVRDIEQNVENDECFTLETDPLLYISRKKDLKNLLTHPVFTSFIYLKWQRIRSFFYINLLFYILFCSFLTIFILFGYKEANSYESIPANSIVTESEKVLHEKVNVTKIDKPIDIVQESSGSTELLRVIVIMFTSVLIGRELFQFSVSPKKYLSSFENWLEIILLLVTLSIILMGCNRTNGNVRLCPQFCAIAILASWSELVLLIGKHPLLSVNIEMFKTVSVNFLNFLAWYAILIIAFALSFYTLFRGCTDDDCSNENPFINPGNSLFKTIVMLTGEFEAGDIPFVSFIGTSHVIFVLFVFLIAIVLFNLLNGLAVSDTQAIRDDALLYSYISRVKLISYIEAMLLGDPVPFRKLFYRLKECCCSSKNEQKDDPIVCFEYLAKQIIFFPRLIPNGVIFIYPNKRNKIQFEESEVFLKVNNLKESEEKCFSRLSDYYLDSGTVKMVEDIISQRKCEEIEDRSDLDNLKLELISCVNRLGSLQQKFEALEYSNKQNEKLLIQILAILSLNNANNDR